MVRREYFLEVFTSRDRIIASRQHACSFGSALDCSLLSGLWDHPNPRIPGQFLMVVLHWPSQAIHVMSTKSHCRATLLTFPHQGQASFPLMTPVPCTDFSYYQLIDSRRTLSHFYFPHFEFQRFPKFQNTHLYTHTHTTFSKMSLVA